jgi:hypothetical protein
VKEPALNLPRLRADYAREVDERRIYLDRVWRESGEISTNSWARKRFDGRRRAIAFILRRAKLIASNNAQRTSIRFGSHIWNRQGALLP